LNIIPPLWLNRYEFSETRKVLEEFFKVEEEFPLGTDKGQNTDYAGKLIRWEF
jgi:hypothetical protein